jgi:hypothetical protein
MYVEAGLFFGVIAVIFAVFFVAANKATKRGKV